MMALLGSLEPYFDRTDTALFVEAARTLRVS
ncbi:hypothetical protein SAMN05428985_10226 [Nocardioides sp. YR527]|nr:hypothetical protein SAMN05428985_10226 [Nocardioides sp. YR527]